MTKNINDSQNEKGIQEFRSFDTNELIFKASKKILDFSMQQFMWFTLPRESTFLLC